MDVHLVADDLDVEMLGVEGRLVQVDQAAGRFEVPRIRIYGDDFGESRYEEMSISFDFTDFQAGVFYALAIGSVSVIGILAGYGHGNPAAVVFPVLISTAISTITALLVLDEEHWAGLAQEQGVDPRDPQSLGDAGVLAAVGRRVKAALKDFPGYAKVRQLHLSLEPWSIEDELITPTLKVKRAKVLARYADAVEAMYLGGPAS